MCVLFYLYAFKSTIKIQFKCHIKYLSQLIYKLFSSLPQVLQNLTIKIPTLITYYLKS